MFITIAGRVNAFDRVKVIRDVFGVKGVVFKMEKKLQLVTPVRLFLLFLKIGAVTIGGGLAMLPLLQVELVDKREWLDHHEFVDCLAVAQSVPGSIAINFSIVAGYHLQSLTGCLFSLLGVVIPPFLFILAVVMFLWQYRENPLSCRAFQGIRPAVAALIAASAAKLGRAVLNYRSLLLLVLLLGGLFFLHLHPICIIIGGAVAGLCLPLNNMKEW